ncbi:MAG: hypothetical protein ACKOXO_06800 [Cyanobium sp.]
MAITITAQPVDDGARLCLDDEVLDDAVLAGAAIVAVLLSLDGRVIAPDRPVVGGG